MFKMDYLKIKTAILLFFFVVYPLFVIPGPLNYFRGPRYIALAIVASIALIFLVKERAIKFSKVHCSLYLFLFFLTLSTIFADDALVAWLGNGWRFMGFSTYLFCIILFLYSSNYNDPRLFFKPMILSATIVALIGILQYMGINFMPHEFYEKSGIRAYSTFGNVNWFGAYLGFILPASMLLYIKEKKEIWLFTTALLYAGLLVSLTRGAWLVFIIIFFVIAVVLFKNNELKKPFFVIVIVLVLVTIMVAPLNEWLLLKRAFSIPEVVSQSIIDGSIEDSGSIYERIFIWNETISIIRDNMLFGIGLDHLNITMPSGRIETGTHNIYLEIAVSAGVFALITYLYFLSNFLRRQYTKTGFIFLIMIFTYLLQGLSNNAIVQTMPIFYIVLGLSLANRNTS